MRTRKIKNKIIWVMYLCNKTHGKCRRKSGRIVCIVCLFFFVPSGERKRGRPRRYRKQEMARRERWWEVLQPDPVATGGTPP